MTPEKEFENEVKDFLRREKCWLLKTFSNGIQRKGVPDLLVCCNGYFVGVELKAPKGKASDLQMWNIRQIRKANGFSFVLYPSGFDAFKKFIRDLRNDEYTHDISLIMKGENKNE